MSEVDQIHVAAICGSLRKRSYTRMALRYVLQGAGEVGASTHLINLTDYDLVFCDGSGNYPDGVMQLRADVSAAQGIILGTPVYHGSYSGVLKNALDLMGFREFEGSIWGLLGVAGGSTGAMVPLTNLRTVGRSLHAWVVPDEVSIPNADRHFDDDGVCTDQAITDRMLEMGRKVARFAYLHHAQQTQEFVRLWEKSVDNPSEVEE